MYVCTYLYLAVDYNPRIHSHWCVCALCVTYHLLQKSQPDLGPHKLKHFHYTSWPDHGVPSQPSSLMKFVQKVRREYKDDGTPMVVHCRLVKHLVIVPNIQA